ncbi:MAG: hypothetical protein GF384_00380 [Elusimicrobia bacterium]|nr:hypothetical protein [Elusimicrobiota bacterium]MBD3411551.1 hypothetical protein [Elusimicrobiota bacterium]
MINMRKAVLIFLSFGVAVTPLYGGIAEDVETARADVTADMLEVSQFVNDQIVEGLAFNAGAGNAMSADVIQFPGFGLGFSLGAAIWPIDAGKFQALDLRTIETSSASKLDMPDNLGMINGTGHVRVGLPFDFDISARFGEASFSADEGNADTDVENTVWGVEVRRRLLGGMWTNIFYPDIAVCVSFDAATGTMERTERYEDIRNEVYAGTAYTQEIAADTRWRTEWNVQNIAAKAMISKTFLIITPFLGLGVNKHTGDVETDIRTSGQLSLESSFSNATTLNLTSKSDKDAQDTQVRLMAGFELKILLLRAGFSGEFAGDNKSYHGFVRLQFR